MFGYFGFLIAHAWFTRTLGAFLAATITVMLYAGLIWGVLPQERFISWEAHLCGLLAGVLIARLLSPEKKRRTEELNFDPCGSRQQKPDTGAWIMDLGLTGRSALITGGSKGIGFVAAWALAREGCDVHLAARTKADLEKAKTAINAAL